MTIFTRLGSCKPWQLLEGKERKMSFLSSIHISQHLQQWRAPAVQQRWTENERKVPSVKESKLGINLLLKHREKERKGSGILSEFELKKKKKTKQNQT